MIPATKIVYTLYQQLTIDRSKPIFLFCLPVGRRRGWGRVSQKSIKSNPPVGGEIRKSVKSKVVKSKVHKVESQKSVKSDPLLSTFDFGLWTLPFPDFGLALRAAAEEVVPEVAEAGEEGGAADEEAEVEPALGEEFNDRGLLFLNKKIPRKEHPCSSGGSPEERTLFSGVRFSRIIQFIQTSIASTSLHFTTVKYIVAQLFPSFSSAIAP